MSCAGKAGKDFCFSDRYRTEENFPPQGEGVPGEARQGKEGKRREPTMRAKKAARRIRGTFFVRGGSYGASERDRAAGKSVVQSVIIADGARGAALLRVRNRPEKGAQKTRALQAEYAAFGITDRGMDRVVLPLREKSPDRPCVPRIHRRNRSRLRTRLCRHHDRCRDR